MRVSQTMEYFNNATTLLPFIALVLSELLPFLERFPGNGVFHSFVLGLITVLRAVNTNAKAGQPQPTTRDSTEARAAALSDYKAQSLAEAIKGRAFPVPASD